MHPRKTPLSQNILITHQNGTPLFRTSSKKYNWYLTRGLITPEGVFTFTPRGLGRGTRGQEWGVEERKERCVVCGKWSRVEFERRKLERDSMTDFEMVEDGDDTEERGKRYFEWEMTDQADNTAEGVDEEKEEEKNLAYLTLHHIIPHSYRTHFPEKLKSHSSHDVLPMCQECHTIHQNQVIHRIEKFFVIRYNAPLEGIGWDVDPDRAKTKKAAAALSNPKVMAGIPLNRQKELETVVLNHFANRLELEEAIKEANELQMRLKTQEYRSHGELVIEAIRNDHSWSELRCNDADPDIASDEEASGPEYVKLASFVRYCRQMFLDTMKPMYLSPHWRVFNAVS